MKREGLLRHLRRHGCVLRREGKAHSLWENPGTGHAEAIRPLTQKWRTFSPRGSAANSQSLIRRDSYFPIENRNIVVRMKMCPPEIAGELSV